MSEHATYRIGNAIAVTQQLSDGTWIATFPGFTGFGAVESAALSALAAEVEGAAKFLRLRAIDAWDVEPWSEPIAVVIRTRTASTGDVCGQIVHAATGEVLHECGYVMTHKEARRDAEEVAQRKGYNVVDRVAEVL